MLMTVKAMSDRTKSTGLTLNSAIFLSFACTLFFSTISAARAQNVQFEQIAGGLSEPWGFAFLPDGAILVTERAGNVLLIEGGQAVKLTGGPKVADKGQGGLLDVMVPRDFATTRQVYFTYAKPQPRGGAGTALAVAILAPGSLKLTQTRDLFEMTKDSGTGRHFGSRVLEGPSGHLFVTIGDRGTAKNAQDLSKHSGSIIRLNRDGSIPRDNPFVSTAKAQSEIWSFGHRNPQGAGFAPDGTLWTAEHGAKGGDEINKITKGANYGWPVISYGRNYNGTKIGEGTAKAGMTQPEFYWDPSIAPSGLTVYSGDMFPNWQGDLLIGSLKFDYIARVDRGSMQEVEQIKTRETDRVRAVKTAADGSIWFLSVGNRALYRMTAN